MKAAVVEAFDRPPRYADFPNPTAGNGETLVRVTACGLHPIVRALASGSHYGSTGELPFIPGVDGVGHLNDGRRVYFGICRTPYGSFAEQTVTRPSITVPLPEGLDDVTAAGLANPGMSSRAALMRAQFVADESILILGATGTAGQLAVQVARRQGAKRIVGVGRNPRALAELPALGSDAAISLDQERQALVEAFRQTLAETPIDVVLDYLWGQPAEALLEAISGKGLAHKTRRMRWVQIGNSAGQTISLPAQTLRSSGVELLGSGFGSASIEQIMAAVGDLFREEVRTPFRNEVKAAPLSEVEAYWKSPEQHTRLVFQP